jgi:hypothetical protein
MSLSWAGDSLSEPHEGFMLSSITILGYKNGSKAGLAKTKSTGAGAFLLLVLGAGYTGCRAAASYPCELCLLRIYYLCAHVIKAV